jgi:exopolysaccharide biosynthesis polyprenyl glycosylphosphotransferase
MLQQQVYILNMILMGLDALCVIAAGYTAYNLTTTIGGVLPNNGLFTVSVIIVMFSNNYFLGSFRLYSDRAPATVLRLVWSIFKSVCISFLLLLAMVFLMELENAPRDFFMLFCGGSFLFLCGLRILAREYTRKISRKGFHSRKILVVGDQQRGQLVIEALHEQLSWGHEVVGRLNTCEKDADEECLGSIEDLQRILRRQPIDEVVFALHGNRSVDLGKFLDICAKMGISVRILPALWLPGGHAISVEKCQGIPFLNMHSNSFSANGLLYKRALDIVGGAVGMLLFLIMSPFIGLAVTLDSPGPVLFTQLRKGQRGRTFRLYKFRTMYTNAEEMKKELMDQNQMQGHMFKMEDDPRVTKVGRWLRKTSLDEFPQFINVMRGEMSLVGTRPPTIDEVEKYQPEHLMRIAAKPGITGLWQVSGRNKINDFEQVVELDCRYLHNWRFSDDLKILCKTVWVVLQRKGAV